MLVNAVMGSVIMVSLWCHYNRGVDYCIRFNETGQLVFQEILRCFISVIISESVSALVRILAINSILSALSASLTITQ